MSKEKQSEKNQKHESRKDGGGNEHDVKHSVFILTEEVGRIVGVVPKAQDGAVGEIAVVGCTRLLKVLVIKLLVGLDGAIMVCTFMTQYFKHKATSKSFSGRK